MHTGTLRKVGGSMMIAIPPVVLDQLHLEVGATLSINLDGDHLVLRPERPRYTLEDLLSQCDFSQPPSLEDEAWVNSPPAGRELI